VTTPLSSRPHNNEWPPIPCRGPTTTLSRPPPQKRTPITLLQQKQLNQLNLATMSLHLDQLLTDSTARNPQLAKTLASTPRSRTRSLTSVPSNAASSSPLQRRLLSTLPLQPSQVSLTDSRLAPSPTRSRLPACTQIGTRGCLMGNLRGKTYWPRSRAGAPVRPTSGWCHHRNGPCSTISGISGRIISLIRNSRFYYRPALLVVD